MRGSRPERLDADDGDDIPVGQRHDVADPPFEAVFEDASALGEKRRFTQRDGRESVVRRDHQRGAVVGDDHRPLVLDALADLGEAVSTQDRELVVLPDQAGAFAEEDPVVVGDGEMLRVAPQRAVLVAGGVWILVDDRAGLEVHDR